MTHGPTNLRITALTVVEQLTCTEQLEEPPPTCNVQRPGQVGCTTRCTNYQRLVRTVSHWGSFSVDPGGHILTSFTGPYRLKRSVTDSVGTQVSNYQFGQRGGHRCAPMEGTPGRCVTMTVLRLMSCSFTFGKGFTLRTYMLSALTTKSEDPFKASVIKSTSLVKDFTRLNCAISLTGTAKPAFGPVRSGSRLE
jgi:hypothetical protein